MQADFLVSYNLHDGIDGVRGGHDVVLKSETPGVDQWGDGDVEIAIRVGGDLLCHIEDLDEHLVEGGLTVLVDG